MIASDPEQRYKTMVDLTDDRDPKPWQMLLKACGLTMNAGPVVWLEAIDETTRALARMQSVNLVPENGVESSQLLDHLIGATHPAPLVAAAPHDVDCWARS